ncbi:MAG: insulinase family protein [Chitinophagaceae bacterium]|nr:insulinase family protein [Chitinophagaceae bacterium]
MNPTDRTVAPPLRDIESIMLPPINRFQLSNGIPVVSINAGSQEVTKVELIFDAGRWQEPRRAVAATTSKLLMEGTADKTAQQVAEAIEFYGASITADATIDYGQVSLFSLNKHLDRLFPLLQEVIYGATFPDKELTTYIQNSKQRLLVNLQKVDFLAHKTFNEQLYSGNYPSGYTTSPEDYDQIDASILKSFHASQYRNGAFKIIVAGKITDHLFELLETYFGKSNFSKAAPAPYNHSIEKTSSGKMFTAKKDAVQSGIRIGKMLVNKLHPDYPSLRVLNTIFGGYFGSRLMQNLREDKGYCYGVHSSISSYLHDAHLYVTTEVGGEVTWDAVKEIYYEMERLRSEPVPEEELQLVKNYLLGVFLSDVDGAFNVAEVMRGLVVYGLREDFFYNLIHTIRTITPAEVQSLANKYMNTEGMLEVVAGNPIYADTNNTSVMPDLETHLS